MHVPLAQQQHDLVLGELGIDVGHDDALESEVPRREPGVLPGVRHEEDFVVVDVAPGAVADGATARRWRRARRVAVDPALHVVVVELLAPQQSRHRLADDPRR
jgi:hypothetical protein